MASVKVDVPGLAQGVAGPAHAPVGAGAVEEHSMAPFGVTAIAALVAWNSRHASESPPAVMLYACVLSKVAQDVIQLFILRYWKRGLPLASLGFPARGASSEPQAWISSVQKLAQTSPPLQNAGGVAVIRSPPGPAWTQWVPGAIFDGAPP